MRVLPGASLVSTVPKLLYLGTGLSCDVFVKKTPPFAEAHSACSIWNPPQCVALRALLCACCNGEPTALLFRSIPSAQQRKCGQSTEAHGLHPNSCCLWYSLVLALLARPHLQPADAPSGAYFHQSTLCENALAALYAGVVHPLHPLAGVDSARLLLFSGNAISYMSNRRTQCILKNLNCLAMFLCSTASLLYPCRVARVSRLIGNSDSTAKAHHWQGGRRREVAGLNPPKASLHSRNQVLCTGKNAA
jgi:hypothetical protein